MHPLSLQSLSDALVDFLEYRGPFMQEVLYLTLVCHATRQISLVSAVLVRLLWRAKPVIDLEQVCEEQCLNALLVKKVENG